MDAGGKGSQASNMSRWSVVAVVVVALGLAGCQRQATPAPVFASPDAGMHPPAEAASPPVPPTSTDAAAPPTTAIVCLDPRQDGLQRWQADGEHWIGEADLVVEPTADWDGDAMPETLVATSSLCGATGNCPYVVYLSNHGCPSYAGRVDGVDVAVGAERHHGVLDVETYWKGGCVSTEGSFTLYQYDGREFRVADSVNCECIRPGQPPTPDRDPRCPE